MATLAISLNAKAENLSLIQECLTFEGFYLGLADGSPGPLTDNAIKAFQRSIGRPETDTGLLTPYDAARLTEACEQRKRELGWAPYHLASSNITIELPLGILALKQESPETQRETLRFMGLGGDIGIWIYHTLQPHSGYVSSIYSAIEHMSDANVTYKVWKENWFVISGSESDGSFFYDYCRLDEGRLFCYEMTWTGRADPLVRGVQIMILNSFKKHNFRSRGTASSPLIFTDIPYDNPEAKATTPSMRVPVMLGQNTSYPATGKLSPTEIFKKAKNAVWVLLSLNVKFGQPDFDNAAQGSAIAVGPTTLLTNCHTLKGHSVHLIAREEMDDPIPVWIKAADYSGDRCVLETRNRLPSYVEIKPYDTIDIGEDAYSIGTPHGFDLTIANGIVSGKRDMKGMRYLQTTAPISGGSSGGGLFDCAGRLMGITTFYLDGQNLNFAIAADEFR